MLSPAELTIKRTCCHQGGNLLFCLIETLESEGQLDRALTASLPGSEADRWRVNSTQSKQVFTTTELRYCDLAESLILQPTVDRALVIAGGDRLKRAEDLPVRWHERKTDGFEERSHSRASWA